MSQAVLDPKLLKLDSTQQMVLGLLAVHYAPATRTQLLTAVRRLGAKNAKNRAMAHADLKPVIDKMIGKGLIEQAPQALSCPPEFLNQLCENLLLDTRFARYAAAMELGESNPTHYYTPFRTFRHLIGTLRIYLYRGQLKLFFDLVKRGREVYRHDDCMRDFALTLDGSDFKHAWFQNLPSEMRIGLLMTLLESALWRFQPAEHFCTALQSEVDASDFDTPVILLDAWLLQGRAAQVRQHIATPKNAEQIAQLAWAAMLEGDYAAAREGYEQAFKQLTAKSRRRNLYFHGLAGLFLPAALLAESGPAGVRVLTDRLQRAAKQKDNPLRGELETLLQSVTALAGFDSDAHDLMTQRPPWYRYAGLHQFLRLVQAQWNDELQRSEAAKPLQTMEKLVDKMGYQWLSTELEQFINRVQGAPAPSPARYLVDAYRPAPSWERALDALSALGQTETVAPRAEPQQQSRLIWLLDIPPYGGMTLEPREQKVNKKGEWTKGRAVALKRLLEEGAELAFVSESDRALIRHIQRNSYYGFHYSDHYDLDVVAALPDLAGHPLLFLKTSPTTRVEVETRTPALLIEPHGDNLRMSLSPAIDPDEPYLLLRNSPTRLEVVVVDDATRRIAEIVAEELVVPQHAEAKVREAIASIAPLLSVHSEVQGLAEGTEQYTADARPFMHFLSAGEGLMLELFTHPLGMDGPGFRPGEGARNVIAEIEGVRRHTERDLDTERAQAQSALRACPALSGVETEAWRWQTESPEQSLEVLSQCRALGEEQLVLIWPRGETLRLRGRADSADVSMSLRKHKDWFEADGELSIDDKLSLSLARLLPLLEKAQGRFIALDDGAYIELTERLKQQLDVLRAFSTSRTKSMQFHPLAAEEVASIGSEFGGFKVDAAWRKQLQRLKSVHDQEYPLPSTLTAELRDYQREGFQWLSRLAAWGAGACLADDMGLGKTLQSLALLVARAPEGPALVVAPTSVCANWLDECRRFAPTLNAVVFADGDRKAIVAQADAFDLVICSYGLLQQSVDVLRDKPWHTLVMDEAQAIKNPQTKRAKAANALRAGFRIALSGTPIENHLGELWSLCAFLNPGLLGSRDSFNRRFAGPIEMHQDAAARSHLKRLVQPFVLRRLKTQVLNELPPRTDIVRHVEMSKEEAAFYEALRQRAVEKVGDTGKADEQQRFQVLAEITRLRQACCNPNLIAPELGLASAKQTLLLEIVDELRENGHKALVFSQFVSHLALVREALDAKGISYQYLDGSTSAKRRQVAVKAFQSGDGDLFLISLKAGGTGLNLTAADYVIHLDPWWNPAVEDQASDRAHRIGQQRPVTIYRLVTRGTIEEKIVALHQNKRDLADQLLEGAEGAGRLSTDDILVLLKEEA